MKAVTPGFVYWASFLILLGARWTWLPLDDHGCFWWMSLWWVHILAETVELLWRRILVARGDQGRPTTF